MNTFQDSLFPFRRRFLESVDVVPEEGGIDSGVARKFRDVELFVGEEKCLHGRWMGVVIEETLEADVFVDVAPVDPVQADGVVFAFCGSCGFEARVPKEGLAVSLSICVTAEEEVVFKPYLRDLHCLTE